MKSKKKLFRKWLLSIKKLYNKTCLDRKSTATSIELSKYFTFMAVDHKGFKATLPFHTSY